MYPPVLPIIYYEGAAAWDVPLNFKGRVREGETFGKYIPDFEYYLVPLREFSNEALMSRQDEISIVMLINKLQTAEDVANFRKLPGSEIDAILKDTPRHLLDRIANVLLAFLLKLNVPVPEAEELTEMVREKKVAELFENMQKMDIQAERRNTARERDRADAAEKLAMDAQQQAQDAQRQAQDAQRQAQDAKRQAQDAQELAKREHQQNEELIKLIVKICRESKVSKDTALSRLTENSALMPLEAIQELEQTGRIECLRW